MTYSENIKFSKLNYFDFYLIAVIGFLPISIIIGNLFLNIKLNVVRSNAWTFNNVYLKRNKFQ